jgi:hypothetical protein
MNSNYVKNYNLNSPDVKNKILKYLYKSGVNIEARHENITEKDLNCLRDDDYIICPQFKGNRTWIMFFQLDNFYYAVNFPKHSDRKQYDLVIHPIDVKVNGELYNGTIMEGIYFMIKDEKFLIIDEVYTLAGQTQLLKSKDDRLDNLSKYISVNIVRNPKFNIFVSQYFNTDKNSLEDLYDKIKTNATIQGIIFYPKIYGRKIFYYQVVEADLKENIIKIGEFRMTKEKNADVYKLSNNESDKPILAYIPDIDTSKKCRHWFSDSGKSELNVKCRFDFDKNKWIPIELIEEYLDPSELMDSDPVDKPIEKSSKSSKKKNLQKIN